MWQPDNFQSDSNVDEALPVASTDINPGDIVVMSRTGDPRTLASISATPGRIKPISAAAQGQWSVGCANGKFTNDGLIVDGTTYAAPTASNKVPLVKRGIVRLAITNTSGKKGDYVQYSSGASGAQLFVINNRTIGFAIGRIAQDFTGATANDLQAVELIQHPIQGQSIYYWLENRPVEGCVAILATQPASRIAIGQVLAGTVNAKNLVLINGKLCSVARNKSLALGGVASLTSSIVRFKWVVARSATFGIRSCSGSKKLASYTVSGVTIGLITPKTMTSGEVPIALLIQFSAATQSTAHIKNVRGPSLIPAVGSWGL